MKILLREEAIQKGLKRYFTGIPCKNGHISERNTSKEKIKEIYREAHKRGMEVDHIIPLRSKYICGLHVENNLQLLIPQENWKKGNKFQQEFFHATD